MDLDRSSRCCALLAFGLALVGDAAEPAAASKARPSAPALAAEATIERDARGIPVITAASRTDLAYATGYAHAQDRFFQMDLSRRLAAGELSELFGAVALKTGHAARAASVFAPSRAASSKRRRPSERAVVEAYARGVNAGLQVAATRGPGNTCCCAPQPRDVAAGRFGAGGALDVVAAAVRHARATSSTRRRLERAAAAAATPDGRARRSSPSSTPATPTGTRLTIPPTRRACRRPAPTRARVLTQSFPAQLRFAAAPPTNAAGEAAAPGSNNWAVAGDPHALRRGADRQRHAPRSRRAGGVVSGAAARHRRPRRSTSPASRLPGTPAVAAGSNGQVAWGFTNSYGDFADARWGKCASTRLRRAARDTSR